VTLTTVMGEAHQGPKRSYALQTQAPGYGLPSPDVAFHHGERGEHCRFAFDIAIDDVNATTGVHLIVHLQGEGDVIIDVADRVDEQVQQDPYHRLLSAFFESVAVLEAPTVVEIGSRKSPGSLYTERLPVGSHYLGFDIKDGPNVDVVGDAHEISRYFGPSTVDAAFSLSTIEHLAMPWKAVVDLNVILKQDAIVFFATHQTWPIHEAPWDYWRLSEYAWRVLLNEATGFQIVDSAMGSPGSVVPDLLSGGTWGLDQEPAFLGTGVLARKVGATSLRWDIDLSVITDDLYPG